MAPAHHNNLKIAACLLIGVLVFFFESGAQTIPGHSHELTKELSSNNAGYNPHCQMPDSASVRQECENDRYSPQLALPQREPDPLLHAGTEMQHWIAIDLTGILPVSEPPPNQEPLPDTTLPVPLPARISFCCLRT